MPDAQDAPDIAYLRIDNDEVGQVTGLVSSVRQSYLDFTMTLDRHVMS
jgi:hypothetical protein